MENRAFGKTDMQVSVIGFGGAEIGFGKSSVEQARKLLKRAFSEGLNVIDTAACYEISEELIGQAVDKSRTDYYLFTKCGHSSGLGLPDWSSNLIELSIERSLERLKTDYLDVVHLHSCSEEVLRNGEVIEALQKAKQAGKTRYIGYSGDGVDARYAVELGVFDSLEISINIADQEAIEVTIPKAVEQGMGVIAKRPVANVAWLYSKDSVNPYSRPYWERFQALKYGFLQADPGTAVAKALSFTLRVPGVSTAIVGTKNPDRYHENAKMVSENSLSESQYEEIVQRFKEVAGSDWVGQV